MSTKLDQINNAFKTARLARDTTVVEVIKLLLGEIQRLDKSVLTDSKIDDVIYKMISNIEETIPHLSDRERVDALVNERRILTQFATPEISEDIVVQVLQVHYSNKGEAMKRVKEYCTSNNLRFNGNVVNKVLRER